MHLTARNWDPFSSPEYQILKGVQKQSNPPTKFSDRPINSLAAILYSQQYPTNPDVQIADQKDIAP